MDLPTDSHPLPPLVAIRGLMLPRNGSTRPRLPPLVSIQALTTSAVHALPQRPQWIDVDELLQAVAANSQRENLEQQRLWAELQAAQRTYETLEALSKDQKLKMKEMEDFNRASRQNSESLRLKLTSAQDEFKKQEGVLQRLRGEVTDLENLRADTADLLDENERLISEAQSMKERNAETGRLVLQLNAAVSEAERLRAEAQRERDAEVNELRSQLTASMADQVKSDEDAQRSHETELRHLTEIGRLKSQLDVSEKQKKQALLTKDAEVKKLQSQLSASEAEQMKSEEEASRNDIKIAHLESELATLEGKARQLETEAKALRNVSTEIFALKAQLANSKSDLERLEKEAEALRDDNSKIAGLEAQLATSESNAQHLEAEAEALRNVNTEISELKAQLATSERNVQQLGAEAEALRNDNSEISGLEAQLATSKSDVERLENEVVALRDGHDKLQSDYGKLQTDHDDLRNNTRMLDNNSEIAELKAQLSTSEDNVKDLKMEAESLRSDHDKLDNTYRELCNDRDQLHQQNNDLRKETVALEEHVKTGRLAVDEVTRLEVMLDEINMSKRFYRENYLSLRGAIRTFCRIRAPSDPSEPPEAEEIRLEISHDAHGASLVVHRKGTSSSFVAGLAPAPETHNGWFLDHIFSSADNNDTIWKEAQPLLESALDGAQVVINLYGRSGSGKSYTSQSIWSRLGEFLFPDTENSRSADSNNDRDAKDEPRSQGASSGDQNVENPTEEYVKLWSTEVYCGELFDLLRTTKKNNATRGGKLEVPKSNGVLDPVGQCGATSVVVSDRARLLEVLEQVAQARRSGQTIANDQSSRSHAFTCVELPAGGSITLVDLAGQEREGVGSSKAELTAINGDLVALCQALGKLMASQHKAGRRAPRGEPSTPTKATKKNSNMKVTPPKDKTTPTKGKQNPAKQNQSPVKATPATGIENVWSSPHLLPRIVGALMHRGSGGSSQHGGLELRSKVMFMATLDFSTLQSAKNSEHTLEDLQNAGLVKPTK